MHWREQFGIGRLCSTRVTPIVLKYLSAREMGTKVSEFRRKKYEHFFDFMLLDKDGWLSQKDFMQNVKNLDMALNLGEKGYLTCRRMMLSWWALFEEEANKNGGKINKNRFVDCAVHYAEGEDTTRYVRDQYKAFFSFIDQDNNKVLTFEELFAYYKAHHCTDENRVREIFKRLDTDKDGVLSEEEFVYANICYWLSDNPDNGYEFLYAGV